MATLNERQRRFADFYIELGNTEQAAIKAGYSKNYARGNAHKLLANVSIKQYIDERMEEIKSKRIADQTEILEFLTAMMRGEITEPIPLLNVDGGQSVADVRPSATARKSAAELLGKRYSMWTDKKEVSGQVGVVILDDTGEDEE